MDDLRDLTPPERAVLDAILACDFPGADNLREQAVTVRARRGCACGCGTIELVGYDGGDPLPMPDLGHARLERRPGTVLG